MIPTPSSRAERLVLHPNDNWETMVFHVSKGNYSKPEFERDFPRESPGRLFQLIIDFE